MRFGILALAAAAFAQPAHAASIVQTLSLSNFANFGSFAKFNPDLGQLNFVEVRQSLSTSASFTFSGLPSIVNLEASSTSYTEFGGGTFYSGIREYPTGSALDGVGTSGSTLRVFVAGVDEVASFIGQGSRQVLFFGSPTSISLSFITGSGSIDVNPRQFGSAEITITYDYIAGVPEPATWAMMIAGFGLVGGSMRFMSSRRYGRAAAV